MKVKFIDSSSVAPPPKAQSQKAKAAMDLIVNIYNEGGRKVAQVEPEEDESLRGLKASISRQAKSMNKAVRVWDADGSVYVAVAGEETVRRRGRPRKEA